MLLMSEKKKKRTVKKILKDLKQLPAIEGSISTSSAEAAAHETLGKRNTPALFDNSSLLTSGREKRLTTFMVSPTI